MPEQSKENTFVYALEQFEAIEANLTKLERLWSEMNNHIPDGIASGYNGEYESKRKSYIKIYVQCQKSTNGS